MHSQISKEAFSLQAFSGYLALYNINHKVVFKPLRAIKPCIRLALLSISEISKVSKISKFLKVTSHSFPKPKASIGTQGLPCYD